MQESLVGFLVAGVTTMAACASTGNGKGDAVSMAACEGRRFSANPAIDAEAERLGLPRCVGDGRWQFEVSDERVWWLTYRTEDGERHVAGANLTSNMYAFGVDQLSNVQLLELSPSEPPAIAFDVDAPDYRTSIVAFWTGSEARMIADVDRASLSQKDGLWQDSVQLGGQEPCDWMRPPPERLVYILTHRGLSLSHPAARATNLAGCPAPDGGSFVAFRGGAFDAVATARNLRCAIARGESTEALRNQLYDACDEPPGGASDCEPPAPGPRTCPIYWALDGWIEGLDTFGGGAAE
ncbi:MAG: hypothetical protein IT385_00735 [Deltaproteobacteria bacterium]|nr:hypothetical protein [Deltaproteobacteria bacterium]